MDYGSGGWDKVVGPQATQRTPLGDPFRAMQGVKQAGGGLDSWLDMQQRPPSISMTLPSEAGLIPTRGAPFINRN